MLSCLLRQFDNRRAGRSQLPKRAETAMKWTTLFFVLFAILTIAAAAQHTKYLYGKKCSGKRCLGSTEDKYKRRKEQDFFKKREDLKRQKRSQDELKAVDETITHGKLELSEKAKVDVKPERLPPNNVEQNVETKETPQKRSKNAEKKKIMKEYERQKADRKENREKPAEAPKKKVNTKKKGDEPDELTRNLRERLPEKMNLSPLSEMTVPNSAVYTRFKRSAESESISDSDAELDEQNASPSLSKEVSLEEEEEKEA